MADPKMIMQKAGVVLNDEKKWSKKSSPFAQFGVLVTEEQHASAIKMGDVAFKNMKGEKVARAYVRCMQANCHIKLEEYAKALEKAAQATVEDPKLAYAWLKHSTTQATLRQYDGGIANLEKAIAMGLHPPLEKRAHSLLDGVRN